MIQIFAASNFCYFSIFAKSQNFLKKIAKVQTHKNSPTYDNIRVEQNILEYNSRYFVNLNNDLIQRNLKNSKQRTSLLCKTNKNMHAQTATAIKPTQTDLKKDVGLY
eukprot:TRINITY_DN150_c0_g1_i3.p6 TRINITY_DN150_c0_g1~~TRINITY_DN150_c0_g1_i3.p6  ORF type:complete len:107 (-),score=1.06 TRINITY_DN150_c0_g1_i3:535-855(-)